MVNMDVDTPRSKTTPCFLTDETGGLDVSSSLFHISNSISLRIRCRIYLVEHLFLPYGFTLHSYIISFSVFVTHQTC